MSDLEQKCLSLPREERERLVDVLTQSLVLELNVTGKTLEEIHEAVVKVIGFEFIMPGKNQKQSIGRTIFTRFACLEGFSETMIGNFIHRDHSTVNVMKAKMKCWLEMPRFYHKENELCEQVRRELYEIN